MSKEYLTLHYCPNRCWDATFETVAHVAQDWEVDAFGNFISTVNDCNEVVAEPDNDNIWTCRCCGAEAKTVVVRFGGTIEAPIAFILDDAILVSETDKAFYDYYIDDRSAPRRVFYRAHGSNCFTAEDVQYDEHKKAFVNIYGVRVAL